MKILCHLVHPAHFHFFNPIIMNLKKKGWDVHFTIRNKDVLEDLVKTTNIPYLDITPRNNKLKMMNVSYGLIRRTIELLKIVKKIKPDIMISTGVEIAIIGKLMEIPSILFFEDDLYYVKNWARIAGPLSSLLVCPEILSSNKWEYKTIRYNGYQKLSYLGTNNFVPDLNKVQVKGKYFLLRFAALRAYHDKDGTGITDSLAWHLIKLLETKGKVIISTERKLPTTFNKYIFDDSIRNLHHYLAFAELYIGDSQSMAVEAAMLGTPGIRFNKFFNKISILNELEKKYGLTMSIDSSHPEFLFDEVEKMLNNDNLRVDYQKRRNKMLKEKINVTWFLSWLIENYPRSVKEFRDNPDIQYQYK